MHTTQRSRFRDVLECDGHPRGAWVKLPAIENPQLNGTDGLDFVVVDLEHAPKDVGIVFAIIAIVKASGLSPIVRIPSTETGLIQRLLDSGADGIMFPHIKSPADARRAVHALQVLTYDTPGAGNTSIAGQRGALERREHPKRGHKQVACIVQLENAEAALAAGDIALVDGVGAVLIGAADLAAREGKHETDPMIIELITNAVAAVKLAGVPVGNISRAAEAFVQSTDDLGYDFTVLNKDASLVTTAARRAVATACAVADASNGPFPPWHPSPERRQEANVEVFRRWLAITRGKKFDDYADLQRWSASEITDFWGALWSFFDISAYSLPKCVLVEEAMPGAQWFPGATLNYVDQVFRHRTPNEPAVIGESEPGGPAPRRLSWEELERQVSAVAATLRRNGVQAGDRVIGYLPNITETVVSFLATASLGALWASCGQDYSAPAAVDRLGQLEPKVLIAADGYRYAGKAHDRQRRSPISGPTSPLYRPPSPSLGWDCPWRRRAP